ncbi:hypothetical protein LOTGIDRAFT_160626 [Lottia gigantea]|uniref:Proline-rich transmembrane protein 1 n=1 Tax=Lottia gigantea TaxID=225164 RepID=V3ZVE5_LOTGI|nr:hypothetical protein LOTGIDRAFT_160626 [Lottia gigantea]ESO95473.1 hypothetical protein LOTGIDRAFT_160626 [Lottia gigantea]
MEKSEEAGQKPPSYTEATAAGPPQYPEQPLPGQQYGPPPTVQYGYPGQYTYTQPGQPAYNYPNVVVTHQGYVPPNTAAGPPPPDHMCAAVFVTLCCFWPTGIIAILKASEAKSSYARGDIGGANLNAKSAKQMINISIIVGVISFVLVAVILGLYIGLILNNLDFS